MSLTHPQKSQHYNMSITHSTKCLAESLCSKPTNLSDFASNFHELMQFNADPPLETIWVSCGLSFHDEFSSRVGTLEKLEVLKELFRRLGACSVACGGAKGVVVVAPVVYELYGLIVGFKGKELDVKKVRRKIEGFLDGILGYIGVCCNEVGKNDEGSSLITPLDELVGVWVRDSVAGGEGKEKVRLFFPLLSDQVIEGILSGGCNVSALAGGVIAEAFLFKMCLNFKEGVSREDLRNELRLWAVGSIMGFHNFFFFDVLLKMLLEPLLPVLSLLSSEDEVLLREILYDAVILVDYSFLHPDKVAYLSTESIKRIILARLIVIHEAVDVLRRNGDHAKAIAYINAFSGSQLPSEIIQLITLETGGEGKGSCPNSASPKAFLKWVITLEDQGTRLFDDVLSKHRGRLLDSLKADIKQSGCKADEKKSEDLLFYIDNKGKVEDGDNEDEDEDDEKMNESMSSVFMAAAKTMQSAENAKGRKRKERKSAKKEKQVKFQRHALVDHSGSSRETAAVLSKDDSSSGSDFDNP